MPRGRVLGSRRDHEVRPFARPPVGDVVHRPAVGGVWLLEEGLLEVNTSIAPWHHSGLTAGPCSLIGNGICRQGPAVILMD